MSALHQIERHFAISLPPSYKRFAETGYLDSSNESTYLWVYDAEWIPLDQMTTYETCRDRVIEGLVPFALTGGGSPWAWTTSKPTGSGEYEILLCNRDQELADVYAPTFASWFYRLTMEYACNMWAELDDARAYLAQAANALRQIGDIEWASHLDEVACRKVTREGDCYQFIRAEEFQEVVSRELGQRYIGTDSEFSNQTDWGWYEE